MWRNRGWGAFPQFTGGGYFSMRELKRMCRKLGISLEGLLLDEEPDGSEVTERAASDGVVTREEAAAYLRMSTKSIQRMESDGRLKRCPGLGAVVRYRARDVLKLASAR
jgi:hypothetical protein